MQKAIKEFKPAFCKNSWKGITDAMSNCYDRTDIKDPKMHQCILADVATQETVKKLDEKNKTLGKVHTFIQYHAYFLEDDAFDKRETYYIFPTFTKQHIKASTYGYYKNGINQFNTALEDCNKQ